jgi:hypothetical protein
VYSLRLDLALLAACASSHPFFPSVVVAVFALMGIVVGGLLTLLALFTYKSS